jgi:type I restriction enzyme M protein
MREVVEKFDFDNTLSKLDDSGLLFQVLERFKNVDLHPDKIDNPTMGTIFEELIRKFNEALDENPGEHFTPRDVVHLMVDLLLAGDEEAIRGKGVIRTVCDPCCGSGGMLSITKDHVLGTPKRPGINPSADIHLFGQEVNPETYAICKSDMFMKSKSGRDAENIRFGTTLAKDSFRRTFDYQIANPPYGKDWKRDQQAVKAEHERGRAGRFGAGLPRISDGQLLFLQHMLYHMKPVDQGGARVAIIMNGSPLFTGDAGSGESEIRRWILENDWLEALVALPQQLFYNTGIATYVWVLSNRKAKERRGKVQLIDATSFWTPMRKSLGDKRREIPPDKAHDILKILADFKHDDTRVVTEDGKEVEKIVSKICPTTHFGFRKITVERPLRLNFQASAERIERLDDERAFRGLAVSKTKKAEQKEKEETAGRAEQEAIRKLLASLPDTLYSDRAKFVKAVKVAAKKADYKLAAPIQQAILSALSECDEEAVVCTFESGAKKGQPEPDSDLRDTESVPLAESIDDFFDREVVPHVPDAWIDTDRRDAKDGEVGIVGYEINFNRYFYQYTPPRPLEEIDADIRVIEKDIVAMLREVAG